MKRILKFEMLCFYFIYFFMLFFLFLAILIFDLNRFLQVVSFSFTYKKITSMLSYLLSDYLSRL